MCALDIIAGSINHKNRITLYIAVILTFHV
jgi:hypothetical protein